MTADIIMNDMRKRFDAKWTAEPNSGCWLWTASLNPLGYGQFTVGSKTDGTKRPHLAHRVSYELNVGPIPKGLELDHLCRVRCCVNPDHLEPVTHRENLLRGIGPALTAARQLAKTHCRNGHPYAGDNLYVAPDARRGCRTCHRESERRYLARKKVA